MSSMLRPHWHGPALAAALSLVACDQPTTPSNVDVIEDPGLAFEAHASRIDLSDPGAFTPVPESPVCAIGGGLSQFVLPTGFVATLLASEPGYADLPDMITVNERGPDAGRYLYIAHEVGSNGSVSRIDLETGVTSLVAQRADWERLDGIAWTPWGTILTAEETVDAALQDPAFPAALGGFMYEIDPATGAARVLGAVGARSHEGIRFDRDGNLYGISERNPGYVYKFVADRHGDLTAGTLYALRIVEALGDRTGWAEWVELDGDQAALDSDAAAQAVGATGYARPEDVETGATTGDDGRGGRMLYVAITGEHRVLAVDLRAGRGPRRGQVLVSDYVRQGVNAPSDFTAPDNLALDGHGNLLIAEDPGGTAPAKTRGDDVWLARFDYSSIGQSQPAVRLFSTTDCNAEPTGIYFSKSGRTLFVNAQHRSGDGRDGTYAIQWIGRVDFQVAAR